MKKAVHKNIWLFLFLILLVTAIIQIYNHSHNATFSSEQEEVSTVSAENISEESEVLNEVENACLQRTYIFNPSNYLDGSGRKADTIFDVTYFQHIEGFFGARDSLGFFVQKDDHAFFEEIQKIDWDKDFEKFKNTIEEFKLITVPLSIEGQGLRYEISVEEMENMINNGYCFITHIVNDVPPNTPDPLFGFGTIMNELPHAI